MEIEKQTDGRWRYGAKVFDSEEEAKAFESRWMQARAGRKSVDAERGAEPTLKPAPDTGVNLRGVALTMAAFAGLAFGLYSCNKPKPPEIFTAARALTMCQLAFQKISRDPDKAEIPAVRDFGGGDEAYFAWGPETKVMRMRNGLGLDVSATGSCIVSKSAKKITSLTMNGQSII